jgi:PAS domain S-box-containing protein
VEIDEELRSVLAASGTGTWRWDMATGLVHWDETLEALSGLEPGTFGSTYEAWLETLHPDEVEGILAMVEEAIAVRGAYHFEHRTKWPDGTYRWLECRGQVTTDADGNPSGTVGVAVDITVRKDLDAERAAAFARERRLRDRLEFLSAIAETTATSPDHVAFMRAAASAAIPKLGDWCSIHFRPERGADMEVVVAHPDPAKVEWANALAERFPYDERGDHGVPTVIRTGRSDFIERVTDEIVDASLERGPYERAEMRPIIDELGLTSVITVPLMSARGVLGAMQFVSAESGRIYDREDVALAEVAASRVADALDNMWSTEQHRHISATLQRALLPPRLPEIPGIDVAVRYWPAGVAVQAGGDFYDVFQTSRTAWSILIGDVCGTGPDAAALTGITRHTVRAAARHGQDHRTVLEWLNQAMRLSNRDRFCTANYATLEAVGDAWRFTSSAAGHPRPIVVIADGGAQLLGPHGSLLGVFEDITVDVATVDLHEGDVVVLYTDGLSDLRPPHGRTEQEMLELVAGLVEGRDAAEVAEAIHRLATSPLPVAERGDDVALVVLRVTAPPPESLPDPVL